MISKGTRSFFWEWIVATAVGVLWSNLSSYAYGEGCTGSNCWPFVAIVFAAAVVSTVLFPYFTYLALAKAKKTKEPPKRKSSVRKTLANVSNERGELLSKGFGTCLSVAYSTFVYYLIAEINYSILDTAVSDRSSAFRPGPPPLQTTNSHQQQGNPPSSNHPGAPTAPTPFFPPVRPSPPPAPIEHQFLHQHNTNSMTRTLADTTSVKPSTRQIVGEVFAELGVALFVTLFAAIVQLYTRRSLALHPKIVGAERPPYWVYLYQSFQRSMSMMLGYVWNMALTALIFLPILSASTEQEESLRYSIMMFVKAAVLTVLLLTLHLKVLSPLKQGSDFHDEHSFKGSVQGVLCVCVVYTIAAAVSEAFYGFGVYYMAANYSTAVGIVVAWTFTCISIIATIAFAWRVSWNPKVESEVLALLQCKLIASFLVWYALVASLDELPDYEGSDLPGLLGTAALASIGTWVLAVYAASRSNGGCCAVMGQEGDENENEDDAVYVQMVDQKEDGDGDGQ